MIGMEQNNDSIGRDTEVCGDPLFWFPMRVTYSRELKVKAELNRLARPRTLNHLWFLLATAKHTNRVAA